jgi:hypothetical protein
VDDEGLLARMTSTALNLSMSQTFGGGATNSFNGTGGFVFRF